MGGIAKEVVPKAKCPVLIVKGISAMAKAA
jgi:hypothetical protein